MKTKIFTLLCLSLLSLSLRAQTMSGGIRYEADHRYYDNWNEEKREYSEPWDDFDEDSYFEIDERKGILHHVTPDMESNYYIVNQLHDAKGKIHAYFVVSDARNEYAYYFDDGKKKIYIYAEGDDDIPYRLTFRVKRISGRR